MGNSESTEYAAAGDNNEEGSAYRKHDQEHQGGQYPTKYAETVHHTSLKSVDYSKEDIAFAGGDTSRRQSGVSSRRIIKTSEFSESTTDPIEIVIAPDSGGAIYSNSSSTDGSRRSSRQYMQQQQLQYPRAHSNYSHVQQQQHRQQYSKSLLNQQDNVTDMDLVVSALEKQRLSSQSGGEISLKTTTSTTTAINHPPPPLAMGQSYIMAPISSGNQHSSNMPSSEELTPSSATSKNGSNFFKSVGKRHSFGGTFHSVASSVVPIFSGTGVGPTNHQKRRSLQNSLVPYFTTSKKQDVESSSTAPPDSNHNQQQKKLSTSFKFPFISKRQPSAPESLVLGSFQQQLAGPSQSLLQSNTYKDMSSNTSIQQSQEQPNNSFYQFSNSHQQSDTSGISVKYQHTTPHPLSKDSSLFDSNLVLADPLFSSGNTNGGPAELKFEQHQQQNHASSLTSSARPHLPRERQESDTILNPLSSSYRSASTPPPPPVPKISSVAVAMLPPYPFVKADSKPKSLLMDKLLRSLDVSPMKLSSGPQSPSPISPIQNSSLAAQSDASLDDSDEEVATQPPRINKNILRGDTNRSNSSLYREDARRNDSRRNSVDLNDLKKVALRKTAWNANSSNSSFQLASNSSIGDVNIGSPFGAASANSSSTNPSATGAAGFNSSKKDINQKMSNPSLFNTKQLINQHLMRAMSSDTTQLLDKTMKRANSAKMVMVSSDQLVPLRKAKGSKESLQSVLMLLELRPKKTTVMKKSNSCSTLFVDYTLIKNDLEETLHCAAISLYHQIAYNTARDLTDSDNILCEMKHPLSKHIQFCYQMPSADDIFKYLECLFHAAELGVECAIISLIYIERLIARTGIHLQVSNWARVVLGSLLLASKVWDDHAVWNVDFCQIFPDLDVVDMNTLERYYLNSIKYDVSVNASNYARAYFDLRKISDNRVVGINRRKSIKPLNLKEALKLNRPDLSEESMRDDLKKSDSESHEIEMNMMENGDYGKQSRNFSVAGLAVAVSEATAEPRSTAIHGQHVQPEDATGVVKAERSMRRALSDFIFVASKPPATII